MAYTKQNFKNGQVLNAEQMNKIEQELARVKSYHELSDSPFGDEEVTIFPETAVEFALNEDMGGYTAVVSFEKTPIVGNTYKIVWNGTEYNCEYMFVSNSYFFGNTSVFGGEDTGEPFIIVNDTENIIAMSFTEDINITFSISGTHAKLLDAKYLPEIDTLDMVALGLPSVNGETEAYMILEDESIAIVKKALKRGFIKIVLKGSFAYRKATNSDDSVALEDSALELVLPMVCGFNDIGMPTEVSLSANLGDTIIYIYITFGSVAINEEEVGAGTISAMVKKISLA